MDEKIIDMEIRIAYQDRLIADLDEVVRQFADRVMKIERELVVLREEVIKGSDGDAPANERPPHY